MSKRTQFARKLKCPPSLTSPHNIRRDVAQVFSDWSIHEVREGVTQVHQEVATHSPLHRRQALQRVIRDIVLKHVVEIYIVGELDRKTVMEGSRGEREGNGGRGMEGGEWWEGRGRGMEGGGRGRGRGMVGGEREGGEGGEWREK